MFGYVKPLESELLVREYELYRAIYCGVCRSLRKETGVFSSMLLSYDAVFLALCRMLLKDGALNCQKKACIAHPFRKRACLVKDRDISYAARVYAVLSYEKLRDTLRDGGFFKKCFALFWLPYFRLARRRAKLPALAKEIRLHLDALAALEKEKTASVDMPAESFGNLLAAIFREGVDEPWQEIYADIGFHLGRYIYIADAAEDREKDKKQKSYNPFLLLYGDAYNTEDTDKNIHAALLYELQRLADNIEKLPFENKTAAEHIIKNTVYLGLPARIRFLEPHQEKGTAYEQSL